MGSGPVFLFPLTLMPMQSQAQWRYLFATDKPFAERWARETPGGKGRRYRRLRQRVKASGYGARAGETIAGNLGRGADGKFTAVGSGGGEPAKADKPDKPAPRRNAAAARRERADVEAETRAQEDEAEQTIRDEEDARLDAIDSPKARAAARREVARDRRARAAERRAARRERQATERATRTEEDDAAASEAEAARNAPKPEKPAKSAKPEKPKKGGGGGGGKQDKPEDPEKAAAAAEKKREQEARRAEVMARRAEADARRAAADAKRASAEAERAERTQRELTDLTQRATTPGQKLSDGDWQKLIVSGLAERSGNMLRLTPAGQQQAERKPQQTKAAFRVFKDKQGEYRWIAISSTAFRDKDNEIVSTQALKDDCARADADGEYGPLRWWHCPGVDIGDCDFNAVSGRTLIEMGTFRHKALALAAAKAAPDLELSIGFHHRPNEPAADGAYTFIRRFERSLVPRGRAANPYTAFAVTTKEPRMTPEKLKDALTKLGSNPEARALMEGIISEAQTREKEADAAGVAFKDAPEWAQALISRIDALETIVVERATAEKETAEKAPMPAEEMIEAGVTEIEDGEAKAEEEDDSMLLSEAEITMIADRVAAALMGQLDGIAAKMASVDEELKGRGYQKVKEVSETTIPAIAASLKAIKTTVDELNGVRPARGHRPSEDNADISALLEASLKAEHGADYDPSDELATVMNFLHPATAA